ncbi:PepSY domain-containing protein [Rheinheimera sediminis]|uniref:PepSY-associated TM helix domain-containing protein n=1 Tax=Rheinheimera sp. YQF-1 TaxID=2499626 RepID=UPI000FD7103D|nr:PepSY-associated TM helix domain-containing protein [Rheinheimera sp. YQF-1]RVT41396.1 PepSY domain-containing protein [Rheinheimera sp. YQF-1]
MLGKHHWSAIHRWIGLIVLPSLSGLIVTGAVLLTLAPVTWNKQLTIADRQSQFATISHSLNEMSSGPTNSSVNMIIPGRTLQDSWQVSFSDRTQKTINPQPDWQHTLSESGSAHQTWLNLHNSLALGEQGDWLVLVTGVATLLLIGSGLFSQSKIIFTVVKGPKWRSVYSLHRWFALVFSLFLFIWCFTGVALSGYKMLMQKARSSAFNITENQRAPITAQPDFTSIFVSISNSNPDKSLQGIMLSPDKKSFMVMLLDRGALPWNKSQALSFDRLTGKPITTRNTPWFMKVMIAMKAIHTGIWGTSMTALIYFVIALVMLLISISGAWLWIKRRHLQSLSRHEN